MTDTKFDVKKEMDELQSLFTAIGTCAKISDLGTAINNIERKLLKMHFFSYAEGHDKAMEKLEL